MSTEKKKATWDGSPVTVVKISTNQFAVENDAGETLKTLDDHALRDAVDKRTLSFITGGRRRKTRKPRRKIRKTRRYRK